VQPLGYNRLELGFRGKVVERSVNSGDAVGAPSGAANLSALANARQFLANGDYQAAAEAARLLIQSQPEHLEANTILARSLNGVKHWSEAEAVWRTVHAIAPAESEPCLQVARCLSREKKNEEAGRWYRLVLDQEPDHEEAAERLAAIVSELVLTARSSSRRTELKELIAFLTRENSTVKKKSAAPNDMVPLLCSAQEAFSRDDYTNAKAAAAKILAADSKHAEANLILAKSLSGLQMWQSAEEAWRRVHAISPEEAEPKLQLAVCLERQNEWSEATKLYDEVLKAESSNASARQALTNIADRREDLRNSVNDILERRSNLDPGIRDTAGDISQSLANARRHYGKQEYEKALAFADAIIAISPTHAETLVIQARSLNNLRRYKDAETAWRRIEALQPELPEPPLQIGRLLYKQEQYVEANTYYQKVLKLAGPGPSTAGSEAITHLKQIAIILGRRAYAASDWATSSAYWRTVLEFGELGSEALLKLGKSQLRGGETETFLNFIAAHREAIAASAEAIQSMCSDLERAEAGVRKTSFEHLLSARSALDGPAQEQFDAAIENLVADYVEKARRFSGARRFSESVQYWRNVIALSPSIGFEVEFAKLLLRMGSTAEASVVIDQIAKRPEGNHFSNLLRLEIARTDRQPDAQIDALCKMIAVQPVDRAAWNALIDLLLQHDHIEDFGAALLGAAAIWPDDNSLSGRFDLASINIEDLRHLKRSQYDQHGSFSPSDFPFVLFDTQATLSLLTALAAEDPASARELSMFAASLHPASIGITELRDELFEQSRMFASAASNQTLEVLQSRSAAT
jgi:tetratricopeptide (TPR) repeat protein